MSLAFDIPQFSSEPRILFFLSALMIVATGLFLLSLFRVKTIPEYLVGFYLLCVAQIVLVFEAASLCHRVNEKGFILAGNLVLFALSLIAWYLGKRPRLLDINLIKSGTGRLLNTLRDNPALSIFLFFF